MVQSRAKTKTQSGIVIKLDFSSIVCYKKGIIHALLRILNSS